MRIMSVMAAAVLVVAASMMLKVLDDWAERAA